MKEEDIVIVFLLENTNWIIKVDKLGFDHILDFKQVIFTSTNYEDPDFEIVLEEFQKIHPHIKFSTCDKVKCIKSIQSEEKKNLFWTTTRLYYT